MASAARLLLDLTSEIEEACLLAERDGVHLEADHDRSGFVWIGRIDRLADGLPGSGRRAIERLFEIADEADIDVRLACLAEGGLVDYYEGIGFRVDHDAPPCRDDDHVVMVREPS